MRQQRAAINTLINMVEDVNKRLDEMKSDIPGSTLGTRASKVKAMKSARVCHDRREGIFECIFAKIYIILVVSIQNCSRGRGMVWWRRQGCYLQGG